ncbi:type II toxin-antitoxin system RelE/ParE family toxin [Embleya sp. NPDC059259]|uniref:type II toxin-antitoxin system RelE/ParE family toxin n=1 Tax=unclassified Embleya TaxID=2699296 RepID=UPI003696CB38
MADRCDIGIEPEVQAWLARLTPAEYGHVERAADMLADRATTLGEPYARHLGGGLRELRFHLDRRPIRITYRLAPGRRIILPTVFAKTRIVETAQVDRARRALHECETTHSAATHIYSR